MAIPYMGDAKGKKNSDSNETHTYPILKFFKGDTLLEIGFDNRERLDLHFIQRLIRVIEENIFDLPL